MHKLSQRLSLLIVGCNEVNETSEMVSYSLEAIISSSITALIAFLIAAKFNYIYEFILFVLCFIPIRLRHKSFHFKKFSSCFLCSNIMIALCSIVLKYTIFNQVYIFIFYIIIVLFYRFSIEKNIYETFTVAFIFTLSLFFNNFISLSILLSVLVNIILIIGRIYNEKISKND